MTENRALHSLAVSNGSPQLATHSVLTVVHIELRVESAFRKEDASYEPRDRPNDVRLPVLIQNVFVGGRTNLGPSPKKK